MAGRAEAYKVLYDRYAKAMYNTALRITNNEPDAEDILQEAFTDAFAQLKSFAHRSTFGAWLKQIVIYKSLGLLRKKRIQFVEMETAGELPDVNTNADETWYDVDMVRKTMMELPDGYRTVLSLHLLEGYNHEEIAELLDVAHSTVRSQYLRAKQKLIDLIKTRNVYER